MVTLLEILQNIPESESESEVKVHVNGDASHDLFDVGFEISALTESITQIMNFSQSVPLHISFLFSIYLIFRRLFLYENFLHGRQSIRIGATRIGPMR